MIRFTMRVEGANVLDPELIGLKVAYADLRPVWPEVSEWMEQKMDQRFQSGGGSDGGAYWMPLTSHAYAVWKHRNYPSAQGKLLRRTFRLHASLTDEGNSFSGDAVRDMSRPDRFTFGTTVPYALYHHAGMGRNPKREIMFFSDQSQKAVMKIIHRFIIEALRGATAGFNTGVGRSK